MYYTYQKKNNPEQILVYIEEFNKTENTVLIDFIDSNEYVSFLNILETEPNIEKESMILIKGYKGRTIRENTIYAIRPEIIKQWSNQINSNNNEDINSYIIGYEVNCNNLDNNIFDHSVSLNDYLDHRLNYYMRGGGNINSIPLENNGNIDITIRNVGQGNWNEIKFSGSVKIVYDAGAPLIAKKTEVQKIIGNRNSEYRNCKPLLILSHWDKDHYHSLLGMSDSDLTQNFSGFICRDRIPNITSRKLFSRIEMALGFQNVYTIRANPRKARGGPTYFEPINSTKNAVVIYNSDHHKNRNISGLALSVKNARASIVLPGDAHYEQITRDILPDLNYPNNHYLIVPHHGGKAGNCSYTKNRKINYSKAVISVGRNRYGHPLKNNITDLKSCGFDVLKTSKEKKDINLKLV